MELSLGLTTQFTQGPTGFKQRGAQPLGKRAKRCAIADGARLGDAIEIIGWDQLGMDREGDGRRQVELSDLLFDITGDELDSRLHFRHHPLGLLDTLQAALAQSFVLGNGANLRDVSLDIRGNESTIATHPALQVDKVVGVANAPDTRLHLGPLLSETLVLTTGRCERVLGLLQAHGFLWGTARPVRCGRLICALRVALHSYTLLPG